MLWRPIARLSEIGLDLLLEHFTRELSLNIFFRLLPVVILPNLIPEYASQVLLFVANLNLQFLVL